MSEKFTVTKELVDKVIETVDAGLVIGMGIPKPSQMCVEAAVNYAMGLPHGDRPTCVSPVIRRLKINLNDRVWSWSWSGEGDKKVRAKGLRRLAVAQLGTADFTPEQNLEFAQRYAKAVLPPDKFENSYAADYAAQAERNLEDYRKLGFSKLFLDASLDYAGHATVYANSDSSMPLAEKAEIAVQILIDMKAPATDFIPEKEVA